MMNAQEKWRMAYRKWKISIHTFSAFYAADEANDAMQRYRREAALERKLAAAQREIERAVQAEREACAMVAEHTPLKFYDTSTSRAIAAAIRARAVERRLTLYGGLHEQ
jgi:hypothetical protein